MSLTVRRGFRRRGPAAPRHEAKRSVVPKRRRARKGHQHARCADVAVKSWARIWRTHVKRATRSKQALGCPAKELPLLTVIYVVTHLEKG